MLLLCLVAATTTAARAQLPPQAPLSGFHHTRWNLADGAPGGVVALAQTQDGFLWLGSPVGLYRFDGLRFELFAQKLPSDSISSLLALRDGGLWIGYRGGGASLLDYDGGLHHYGEAEGLPPGRVWKLEADARDIVWAATDRGLYRLQGGRWQAAGEASGFAGRRVVTVLADAAGTLWVGSAEGLYTRAAGATRFVRLDQPASTVGALAQGPDGAIWSGDAHHGLRRFGGVQGAGSWPLGGSAQQQLLLPDREGGLWLERDGRLLRIADARRLGAGVAPESLAEVYGDGDLSGEPWCMLQDREGSIWVGSSRGLDRFRANPLRTVAAQGGAIAAAGGGDLWVMNHQRGLLRIGAANRHYDSGAARDFSHLYREPDGTLWLGSQSGLWRLAGDKLEPVPLPIPIPLPVSPAAGGDGIAALMRDRSGGLWMSVPRAEVGVWRLAGGVWAPWGGRDDLPHAPVLSMVADAAGRLWFGYADQRIACLDGARLRVYGADDGLQIGAARVLYTRAGKADVWAAGPSGVARFDGRRFAPLVGDDGDAFRGVNGMVESAAGELWLNGAAGISRITAADLADVRSNPRHPVRYRRFDTNDGLDGGAVQMSPLPSVAETEDGRLWFAAGSGIVRADPAKLRSNRLLPTVLIRAVRADDALLAPAREIRLPRGTTRLQIDYTATSLAVPERVRFRYRLEGVDTRWQDAGTRRQAFYTNLGAGRYRFQVIASNDAGVWNNTGTTISLDIAPAFYQQPWFAAAGVLVLLGLLRLLHLLRLRQIAAQLRVEVVERHRERERIARELHDTLLQGVQGLVLRFQSLASELPQEAMLRQRLDIALERADRLLAEGRQRVAELHATASDITDLAESLELLGRELAQERAIDFRLDIEGSPRPLQPLLQDEVHRIAREALINAFVHSDAARVDVLLGYDKAGLRLRVRDDGVGIDEAILKAGGRAGHGGLAGMRERAARIGGSLAIVSSLMAGTEIDLSVPARRAYRGSISVFRRV